MDVEFLIKVVLGLTGMLVSHWVAVSCSQWYLRLSGGLVIEPWLYEPAAPGEVPPKQQKYLDSLTPQFQERGFACIGDYVVRRKPQISTARCFLNAEGTTLGVIEHYCGARTFSCVSLCEDGMYVETSGTEDPPKVPAQIPMLLVAADPRTVAGVIEQHEETLHDYCAAKAVEVLPMTPEDFREVVLYGQRLVMRMAHANGLLPEVPEFAREKGAPHPEAEAVS